MYTNDDGTMEQLKAERNSLSAIMDDMRKGKDLSNTVLPVPFIEKMLSTNSRMAYKDGRETERDELVCRLLASGMVVDEISVILNIRADAIRIIEQNYEVSKIPDYIKKLKARRRGRERAAARNEEMKRIIAARTIEN